MKNLYLELVEDVRVAGEMFDTRCTILEIANGAEAAAAGGVGRDEIKEWNMALVAAKSAASGLPEVNVWSLRPNGPGGITTPWWRGWSVGWSQESHMCEARSEKTVRVASKKAPLYNSFGRAWLLGKLKRAEKALPTLEEYDQAMFLIAAIAVMRKAV